MFQINLQFAFYIFHFALKRGGLGIGEDVQIGIDLSKRVGH